MVVAVVLFHKTIDIASPPSRVFDLLTRPGKAALWQPWTSRAAARDGERLEDGSLFSMVNEALGVRLSWTGVAEVEAPRRFGFRQVAGDFRTMEGTWEVGDSPGEDAASRVHLSLHVELPFVLPRLVTVEEANRHLSSALDDCLFNLKGLLEADRPRRVAEAGWGWYPPVGQASPPRPRLPVPPRQPRTST